jgi:hypothetical protein
MRCAPDQTPHRANQMRRAPSQMPHRANQMRRAPSQMPHKTNQMRRAPSQTPHGANQMRRAPDQTPHRANQTRRAADQMSRAASQTPLVLDAASRLPPGVTFSPGKRALCGARALRHSQDTRRRRAARTRVGDGRRRRAVCRGRTERETMQRQLRGAHILVDPTLREVAGGGSTSGGWNLPCRSRCKP